MNLRMLTRGRCERTEGGSVQLVGFIILTIMERILRGSRRVIRLLFLVRISHEY